MQTPPSSRRAAFTLIELLVVITIIVLLVGLTVGVAGYANQKAARSRAESEIKALSAALESYKADNGIYPRQASTTDSLDARTATNPSAYTSSSKALYALLTGEVDGNGVPKGQPAFPPAIAGAKVYFEFKPNMLGGKDNNGKFTNGVTAINDPYGSSYGYSTYYQADLDKNTNPPTHGYNPTFDLWSTAGATLKPSETVADLQKRWIVNW